MRTLTFAITIALATLLIGSILLEQPRTDRDWDEDFAFGPNIEVSDSIRISTLRDYSYAPLERSYSTLEIDPDSAERMWLLIEPFRDNPIFAHTFFSFDGDEYVSFSIEARRERNEPYSATAGLWRRYELLYMWGSERDFIGRRVVHLNHTVLMLPINASSGFVRDLLFELAQESRTLEHEPRFYHTLTDTCTTELAEHVNAVRPGTIPLTKHRFMPGLVPELLYREGLIATNLSYDEMLEAYDITAFVRSHPLNSSFSSDLRAHLETVE